MIHMDAEEETLHALSVLEEGGTVLQTLQLHPEPDDGWLRFSCERPFWLYVNYYMPKSG